MKIYFAGSIRGGRDDKEIYLGIIGLLGEYGSVLTEHIGEASLTSMGEGGYPDEEIYRRDMAWLTEADAVVAEVTRPSLGVGYEIGKAEDLGKKILCIARELPERRVSAMIAGSQKITLAYYETTADLKPVLDAFFGRKSLI